MKTGKTTKQEIIELYEQRRYTHPPYSEIAKKVGVHKSYVGKILQIYKLQNAAFGLKK